VLRRVEERLPGRVDAVIAASPAVAERVGGRVIPPVWPPPVVHRDAASVRAELGLAPDHGFVVTVARLHPQKGLDVLVDAAALLRHQAPGARIVIVGAGPLASDVAAWIAAAGVRSTVQLVGSRADTADILAAADVVVVPSIWESGPFVAFEAMELGTALVATPVGMIPELVTDGVSGRIVPIGAPAALAAAIAALLADPAERVRLAAAARARLHAVADPGRLVDEVVDVYRRVVSSR
jgi:glycosyltransferase involved in cell wall biosynthesis